MSQNPPRIKAPIFKCVTPPNFSLLKEIVLKDYQTLRIPNPKFVSLRHPTLSNTLVRAHITQSESYQLELHFSATSPHTNSGNLPCLVSSRTHISKCKDRRCATCPHLDCRKFFSSEKTSKTYTIRHSFNCSSRYIIYLITCSKCKKQYVGQTTQKLKTRFNHYRSNILCRVSTYIANHFNLPSHSIQNVV